MPQNNQSITESPEFKEFCKAFNLDVFNQEAVSILLFKYAGALMESEKRADKLEEMIMEMSKNLISSYDPLNGSKSLFDKWNLGTSDN